MELNHLNLGCGENKKAGYVNLDWQEAVQADVVHDLNRFPYPFSDDTFDVIGAFHVIEHLDRPFAVMKELHRMLKPGGMLQIRVPRFSRGFTHAEHSHGFDVTFPLYFNKEFTKSGYMDCELKLVRVRRVVRPGWSHRQNPDGAQQNSWRGCGRKPVAPAT